MEYSDDERSERVSVPIVLSELSRCQKPSHLRLEVSMSVQVLPFSLFAVIGKSAKGFSPSYPERSRVFSMAKLSVST